MKPWRWVLLVVAGVVVVASLYLGPYFGAQQATTQSINRALAAQNTPAAKAENARVARAVAYLNELQSETSSNDQGSVWVIRQIYALCYALHYRAPGLPSCRIVPLPPALKALKP